MLIQFSLTIVGLLVCVGDVAALATLLTWQERAADPISRRQRLLTAVLPVSSLLLLLLLLSTAAATHYLMQAQAKPHLSCSSCLLLLRGAVSRAPRYDSVTCVTHTTTHTTTTIPPKVCLEPHNAMRCRA